MLPLYSLPPIILQIKGEVIREGVVTALSERQGVASVQDDTGNEMSCPVARLMPPRKEVAIKMFLFKFPILLGE